MLDPSGRTGCMGVRAKIDRVLKLKKPSGINKTTGKLLLFRNIIIVKKFLAG